MKSRVEKDKIKRFFFQSFGYCLKRQTSSLKFKPFFIRRKPFISFVSIRNRCVINFKSRFLINQFKVSRFVFRQQALLGHFKNVFKQSWLILFFALMVEMVDTKDSKSFTLDSVLVQVQLRVLLFTCKFYMTNRLLFFFKNPLFLKLFKKNIKFE